MNIVEKLIYYQSKGFYRLAHIFLVFLGLEIPKEVKFLDLKTKDRVRFVHRAPGTVFHTNVVIGKRVQVYQNVTIGSATPWEALPQGAVCEIKDDAILCAGAKILFKNRLIVGKGTIIAANSVLTQSTGDYEIWGGVPAKKIKDR